MRVALLTGEVPNAEYSSSTYVALLLGEGLRELGHEVDFVLPLPLDGQAADTSTRQRWLDALSGRFGVHVLDNDVPTPPAARTSRLRRIVRRRVEDFFPERALAPSLAPTLRALAPDALLLLSYEAVAATDGVEIAPRFAFLGEPPHMPLAYRRRPPFVERPSPLPRRALESLELRAIAAATIRLLRRCEGVALNAAHHAAWVRDHGVPHCRYLRYPAADWSGPEARGGRAFRIVLLGRVTGSSTLPGLHLFAEQVLPRLERTLNDDFEVHVCGGGQAPAALASRLDRPSVRLRGYVDDAAAEVRAADVFLVPTPLELGARVRIPFAWSTGVCVVSHAANALGLPELTDGENVLLGSDGAELAAAVVRAHADADARSRIGAGGRRSWETFFAPPVAAAAVEEELNALANGPSRSRVGVLHA